MILSPSCNVIVVGGGKGGVGKSVFAANLALAFMIDMKQKVLLIDADARSCGDQNVILGVRPLKTIAEVAQFQGSLSPQSIPQMVTAHATGLSYIGAVRTPDESLNVNPEAFMKPLEFLSRHFQYIIIDVGTDYGPLQMQLIQEATVLMILTMPEVLVMNQTQRMISELLAATLPMDMFQLVINRAGPGGITPQAIAQNLRLNPVGIIPQDDITTSASLRDAKPFVAHARQTPITAAYHEIVRKLTGGILQKMKTVQKPTGPLKMAGGGARSDVVAVQKEMAALSGGHDQLDERNMTKIRIHNELIRLMDLKKNVTDTNGDPAKEEILRKTTMGKITEIVDKEVQKPTREERSKLIKEVLEEALGYGPLEDLLADPNVTEIMVNGHKKIFIEKKGKIQLSETTFTSNGHLRNVIERIVTPLGRRIDEKSPYVDARLRDGSRVNAIIEPLSIDGPALTIRKFKKEGFTPENYIEWGSMSRSMVDFLRICVKHKMNIVISGGTGSGKTSLLNMISSFIPSDVRIVTIEDAAELRLVQDHVVRLETRPANMEGSGAITIRDLVRNSLRMRPDRIVVGETRDGSAFDMLQAMNTGHDGSMTTTHSNSPRECIARLETLCMQAGMDMPVRAIREQIASAVHIIVQISRLTDGSRKIMSITEVCGMQGEAVTMQEIFRFKETGYAPDGKTIVGIFQAMGLIPTFIEKIERKGEKIPRDLFSHEAAKQAASASAPKQGLMPSMPTMKKVAGGGTK